MLDITAHKLQTGSRFVGMARNDTAILLWTVACCGSAKIF
jgi:hypothetical protein